MSRGIGTLLAVTLTVVLASSSARAGSPAVERFAIVIGNNVPDLANTPLLRYADDDAVATHMLLSRAGVKSVLLVRTDDDTSRIHPTLKAGGRPTFSALDRTLSRLNKRMDALSRDGRKTELLIFYSGHGDVAGGEGYLVLEDERLTRTKLHDRVLKRSRADRNHVIVDACKSYFMAFERGARRQRYPKPFAKAALPSQLANTGFILSTSSARDSHEWERYQAGIFSYEVRSALRGAADANTDGTITYAELGAFLTAANQAIVNPRFRPEFTVHPPGRLSRGLLSWNRPDGTMRVSGGIGHVYVETADGERVMDVHADSDQELVLHVPDSRPLFLQSSDERTEYRLTGKDDRRTLALPPVRVAIAHKGAMHLAFERLFETPFGRGAVVQYRRTFRKNQRGPPGLSTPAAPRSPPSRLRPVAGWIAISAVAVGVSLNALAAQRSLAGRSASQQDRERINHTITTANTASIALYATAAAAGLAWWALGRSEARDDVLITPTAARGSFGVSLFQQF